MDKHHHLKKYSSLHNKYLTRMSSIISTHTGADVYDQISNGHNQYLRVERSQSSSFDMEWIKEIENAIYDLGQIINNPKKNTKTEETLVAVELARKTNATSVRHLASHSENVKEVKENGDIIPSKVLNIGAEDDYATYENRFVATLIRRLVLFIEKRYEYIQEYAEIKDAEILMVRSKSHVDGKEVEIETKVKVLSDNDVTGTGKNSIYLHRIDEIRRYVRFYYNSPFMKTLKNERDVRAPILMTNIIRKNPLYHHAYELYRFIEKYDTLGVNVKVSEKYNTFTEDEIKDVNATLLANFLAVNAKDPEGVIKHHNKEYKPKILTSVDDEEFVYGEILNGPIQFVRMDEAFKEYLRKRNVELPPHLTKEEKEYYADDLERNRKIKVLGQAENQLLTRKEKEERAWDKKAEKLVAEREAEEAELKRQRLEEIRQHHLSRIQKAREELEQEAREHASTLPESLPQEETKDFMDIFNGLNEENPLLDENPEETQIPENSKVSEPIEENNEETTIEETVTPEEIVVSEEPVQEEKDLETIIEKPKKKRTRKAKKPKEEVSEPEVKEEVSNEEQIFEAEPESEPEPIIKQEPKPEPVEEPEQQETSEQLDSTITEEISEPNEPVTSETIEEVQESKPFEEPLEQQQVEKPKKKRVRKAKKPKADTPKEEAKEEAPVIEQTPEVSSEQQEVEKPKKKKTSKTNKSKAKTSKPKGKKVAPKEEQIAEAEPEPQPEPLAEAIEEPQEILEEIHEVEPETTPEEISLTVENNSDEVDAVPEVQEESEAPKVETQPKKREFVKRNNSRRKKKEPYVAKHQEEIHLSDLVREERREVQGEHKPIHFKKHRRKKIGSRN